MAALHSTRYKVLALHKLGKYPAQIAKELHISRSAVSQHMKRLGLTPSRPVKQPVKQPVKHLPDSKERELNTKLNITAQAEPSMQNPVPQAPEETYIAHAPVPVQQDLLPAPSLVTPTWVKPSKNDWIYPAGLVVIVVAAGIVDHIIKSNKRASQEQQLFVPIAVEQEPQIAKPDPSFYGNVLW